MISIFKCKVTLSRTLALLGLLLGLRSAPITAHELDVARVQLLQRPGGRYVIEGKLPLRMEPPSPRLPERCQAVGPGSREVMAASQVLRWEFDCRDPSLAEPDHLILPWGLDGAFVVTRRLDGQENGRFFDGDSTGNDSHTLPAPPEIVVPLAQLTSGMRSPVEIARHYIALGVEHILFGWDHLAFVLALFLIAAGWQLARLATAFTIGHSITLALAVLQWVTIPIPPVEACIALSIAFVAREVLRPDGAWRHGIGLVFGFGLLHGLGFASALHESGIARGKQLLGLLTFNVGVELGQLLILLVLTALVWAGRGLAPARAWLRPATAFTLGALGLFWTFERII